LNVKKENLQKPLFGAGPKKRGADSVKREKRGKSGSRGGSGEEEPASLF